MRAWVLVVMFGFSSCQRETHGDGGYEAGHDGGYDAGHDGGYDAGHDGGYDAGYDGGSSLPDCREGFELPADYSDPPAIPTRLGSTRTFNLWPLHPRYVPECFRITVEHPSGSYVVDSTFQVTVTFDQVGLYTVTLSQRFTDAGPTMMEAANVFAEPPPNPPCVTLARECSRVGRSGDFFACDESLFDLDGGLVATLDGGEWFAADDTLFAWADGELRAVGADGLTTATTPWSAKPELWSADRHQLAVWNGNVGARFASNGLLPLGTFSSEVPLVALAVQPDGELLRVSNDYERLACSLDGGCAKARYPIRRVKAANADTIRFEFGFFGEFHSRMTQVQGAWLESEDDFPYLIYSPHVQRRLLKYSGWGARFDGQTSGDMRFDGLRAGGAADDVVWLTDRLTTRVWCE